MAIGDKYVAVLSGHSIFDLENVMQNVFAYEGGTGSSTAFDLADTIGTTVVSVLAPITSGNFMYDTVEVINLDDPSDFAIRAIGTSGSVAGEIMPKFVAWGFEYFRATREVANGRKSFAGVPETLVENGDATAVAIPLLEDLAELLSNDLDGVSVGVTYIPRIWRRAGTYGGVVQADTFYPISAVGYRRVSTQNTRKR